MQYIAYIFPFFLLSFLYFKTRFILFQESTCFSVIYKYFYYKNLLNLIVIIICSKLKIIIDFFLLNEYKIETKTRCCSIKRKIFIVKIYKLFEKFVLGLKFFFYIYLNG